MSKQREIDAPAAIPLVQALCADDGRVRRVSVRHSATAPALRVLRRMLDHADAVADEGRWYTMHWPPDGIREDPLLADLPAEALHEQALDLIVTYLKCRLDLREPDGESTRRLALIEEMYFAGAEREDEKPQVRLRWRFTETFDRLRLQARRMRSAATPLSARLLPDL